jgi:methylglutamate dehydrogenase subunit B
VSRLVCPFCGPRELEEFLFRKSLSEPGASAYAEVYERLNRPEDSLEHWQHVHGCRAWLVIRRDPTSGDVLEIELLGGGGP